MNIYYARVLKILFPAFAVFFLTCNFFSSSKDTSKDTETLQGDGVKFHTAEKTGTWKKQASDHVPLYAISYEEHDGKKYKIIMERIPFKGAIAPLHYVEALILTDYNHNELQKVSFHRGNQNATAVFRLPMDHKSHVFIIAKCNLHDMWEARVDWDH
jgi:desulfoferrodoxin (superoxide reductase-like protein)